MPDIPTMHGPSDPSRGQLARPAAEVYEELFVPALFEQWPERLLDTASASEGDDIVDVGCGTGVLARAAAACVGPTGSVLGVDTNAAMLEVARRVGGGPSWREADACHLPLADDSVDCALSQFVLMFVPSPEAAVREMARVTRPGGSVVVATWVAVEQSPGYARMVDLLRRLFGDGPADALLAPFTLGDPQDVVALMESGLERVSVVAHQGVARFASLEEWVRTDVKGWTLADMIDDDDLATLLAAARDELADFVGADGTVSFAAPALIACGTPG